ncbi:MAG TPA: VWA domain-containing protein, partial [Polyangiaceae bacterium]
SIGALRAANGGDYPEAPDIGLATANGLSWRTDATVARLAFWVADAPQHDQYAGAMAQDFSDARAKGIHLYPVSASGADELLEYTMRSGAQITGGRYLFLTDDSGIGDPHLVPSIPCYFVTKLEKAIIRMASIELSGIYVEPDAADVIRTGGNPRAGQCSLGDAGAVHVF